MRAGTRNLLDNLGFLLCFATVASFAPAESLAGKSRGRLTIGLSTLPLKVSGLENIHISDLKEANGEALSEGRLALDLAENNTSTFFAPGVKFDAGYALIPDELDLLLEIGVNIMDAKAVYLGLGADFTLFNDGKFFIQGLGRIGLVGLRVGGTQAETLDGFNDSLSADFGSMGAGDELQATLGGIYATSGIASSLKLFEGIWLRAEVAAFQAFLGPLRLDAIKASDNDRDDNNSTLTRVPLDSASIVEPDASRNLPLELQPRGDSLGLSFFLGLSFDSDFSGADE